MADGDVRKYWGLFFVQNDRPANGGGVNFINFLQKFDRQPILKLLLKYCSKMFFHATYSYYENRGISHSGLLPVI